MIWFIRDKIHPRNYAGSRLAYDTHVWTVETRRNSKKKSLSNTRLDYSKRRTKICFEM